MLTKEIYSFIIHHINKNNITKCFDKINYSKNLTAACYLDKMLLLEGQTNNSSLSLWSDLKSNTPINIPLISSFESINQIIVSPNNQRIACSIGTNVVLLEVPKKEEIIEIRRLETKYNITSISYSKCSLLLASSSNNKIYLWSIDNDNLKVGKRFKEFKSDNSVVYSIAFANKSNFFAAGGSSKILELWEVFYNSKDECDIEFKNKKSIKSHLGPISSVCFSNDDSFLLSGSHDSTVIVRRFCKKTNEYDKAHTIEISINYSVINLNLTCDNKKLVILGKDDSKEVMNSSVTLWGLKIEENTATANKFQDLLHCDEVKYAFFTYDGKYVLTLCNNRNIKIFKMEKELE